MVTISNNASGCNNALEVQEACESCLPEGIMFTTQEQIDNFQTNYPGCTEIAGFLHIQGTDISNLDSLNVLEAIGGGVSLDYNYILTNLNGLSNISEIGGDLWINDNDNLIDLIGLNNLTSIEGEMRIWFNDGLESLQGLENITLLKQLYISNNENLMSLNGIENLQIIEDHLIMEDNPLLADISGIGSLTEIGGLLSIDGCNSLTNLNGLNNISSIGHLLSIAHNPGLISLSALHNLTSIGGDLWISGNENLTSLSGLDNINPGSIDNLNIIFNSSLSGCGIESVCDYLSNPNGTIEIHDNAQGCNSPEEVEEDCLTTVKEIETGNGITIIPNPSKDKITISLPATTGNTQLSIYKVNGEKVLEQQFKGIETQIDISALPRGVYFVRVQDERINEVTKLVKQ